MSEDVMSKLARFTPSGVDRDAMLFAAGRASVRPRRGWKWATAALVVSHVTLLGLWMRPVSDHTPPPTPVEIAAPPDPLPSPSAEPYTLAALSRNPEPRAEVLPAARYPDPSEPLTAFTHDLNP